ncbi:MAG: 4Fe-4S binding protein [Ekhidna sp.]|nr:4Fe-4S binding protein [Ekhidna sp.]
MKTTLKGMLLAISYFFKAGKSRQKEYVMDDGYYEKAKGIFTVQYPKESIPIPNNGRYQLHNEIEDCIVCDKCAKICPVDCIDIEPIRSPDVFGQASDGTPLRIHAAKFDIDMSKCCFCGLCTVVCPTECLTMTKEFDFSTSNLSNHNFSFSKMSEQEIAEKRKAFEDHQKQKAKIMPPTAGSADIAPEKPTKKLVFKPKMPSIKPLATTGSKADSNEVQQPEKSVIKTKIPGKA